MSKTHLEIDDSLLLEAGRLLQTTTKTATVNAALKALLAEERRKAAVAAEILRGRSGYYSVLLENEDPAG